MKQLKPILFVFGILAVGVCAGCNDKSSDSTSTTPLKVAPGAISAGQQAQQSGFAAKMEAQNKAMAAQMEKRYSKKP